MNPGTQVDHEGEPYCKNCYGKNFGPKGKTRVDNVLNVCLEFTVRFWHFQTPSITSQPLYTYILCRYHTIVCEQSLNVYLVWSSLKRIILSTLKRRDDSRFSSANTCLILFMICSKIWCIVFVNYLTVLYVLRRNLLILNT